MPLSEPGTTRTKPSTRTRPGKRRMQVALPEPGLSMDQDAEWCVVEINGTWRRVRFHDYGEIYKIPGLYERLFYRILRCQSPSVVRGLLERELRHDGQDPGDLTVLDLGAGNGMVGEQLAELDVKRIVGVDIIQEAADAARRDRPGIYDEYLVADFTRLDQKRRAWLGTFKFNCLTCVAALGFGDIPPRAFAEAFNLIEDGGWLALNIKEGFLDEHDDDTGFSRLIRRSVQSGVLSIRTQRRYQHRLATNGDPLYYVAVIGTKNYDMPI